jgi:DNA-binding NarL/FixJ family response regulator
MLKSVLIVDDSAHVRSSIRKMLAAEEDYKVCAEAENGDDAVTLAMEFHPDLIILDLAMPGKNGLDAARELKRIMPKTPIILFTQHSDMSDRVGITNLHVDKIVSKDDGGSLMGYVRILAPASTGRELRHQRGSLM